MKSALNLPDSVSVPPTLLILRSKEAQSIRGVAHGAHPTKTEVHSTFLQVKLAVFTLGQQHTVGRKLQQHQECWVGARAHAEQERVWVLPAATRSMALQGLVK